MKTSVKVLANREICYERVIDSIIEHLPEDYPLWDDVFELRDFLLHLDREVGCQPI